MNTQKHILGVAILAALNAPQSVLAEDALEETVVTASRIEQPLNSSLASVSVITAADLERMQVYDIEEALKRLPGIDTDNNGGRGSNAAIRVRGTNSDQVVVLIDGVRTASATSGATAIAHIPVSQIDRIEVVRGPLSGLYGADAVGGVIQVFTKRGLKADGVFKPEVAVETGSHNRNKATAGAIGVIGNTSYSLNLTYESTDGINRTRNASGFDRDQDGYREKSISAGIDHSFDNGAAVGVRYLRSEGDSEFDSSGPAATKSVNENIGVYGSVAVTEALKLTANVGEYLDKRTTISGFPGMFETTRFNGSLQLDYQFSDKQTVVAGYDYYDDQVDSTSAFTQDSRDNKGYFVQYLGNFGIYHTQANLRRDNNEAYGAHTTGNIAFGVDIAENTRLNLSYGEAFKAPTFNDLYYPLEVYRYPSTPSWDSSYVGNPNLSPEESKGYELALRSSSAEIDWSVSLFKTNIENLIDGYAYIGYDVAQGLSQFSTVNVDSAEILGSEATVSFPLLGWQTNIGLTYLSAHDEKTGGRLIRRARTKATVNLSKSFGLLDVDLNWMAQGNRLDGSEELAGYNLVDLFATYHFSEELRVGANLKNLFDTDYTLVSGFNTFATEGRTASVFARYSF